MAELNDLFEDKALYTESADTKPRDEYFSLKKGEYLGHIVQATEVVKEFKMQGKQVKAKIFNFKVQVSEENKVNSYEDPFGGGFIPGEKFAGREIKARGMFKFIEAGENDSHESHSEGNTKYMRFCEEFGFEVKALIQEIDGKQVKVKSLPNIKAEDLNGIPVNAVVDLGSAWVKDGKERRVHEVKFVKTWADGKKLTLNPENVPF